MSFEQQLTIAKPLDFELFDGDKLVAKVKECELTHSDDKNIVEGPFIGRVVFSKVFGEPSLLDTFTIRLGSKEWMFQFVGEKPGPTITEDGQIYNYPIEIDREYQFFARSANKRKISPQAAMWLDKIGSITPS